jgi:hypothetical protein
MSIIDTIYPNQSSNWFIRQSKMNPIVYIPTKLNGHRLNRFMVCGYVQNA